MKGVDFHSCTYTFGRKARRVTAASSDAIELWAGTIPLPNCGIAQSPYAARFPRRISVMTLKASLRAAPAGSSMRFGSVGKVHVAVGPSAGGEGGLRACHRSRA